MAEGGGARARVHPACADDARVRQQPGAGGADRGAGERAGGERAGPTVPRFAGARAAARPRARTQGGGAAGARGDELARARDRHRVGGSRDPAPVAEARVGRLAARGARRALAGADEPRRARADVPRRPGGDRGDRRRHARRRRRAHRRAAERARRAGTGDRGVRVGGRLERGRALRARQARISVPPPDEGRVRGSAGHALGEVPVRSRLGARAAHHVGPGGRPPLGIARQPDDGRDFRRDDPRPWALHGEPPGPHAPGRAGRGVRARVARGRRLPAGVGDVAHRRHRARSGDRDAGAGRAGADALLARRVRHAGRRVEPPTRRAPSRGRRATRRAGVRVGARAAARHGLQRGVEPSRVHRRAARGDGDRA